MCLIIRKLQNKRTLKFVYFTALGSPKCLIPRSPLDKNAFCFDSCLNTGKAMRSVYTSLGRRFYRAGSFGRHLNAPDGLFALGASKRVKMFPNLCSATYKLKRHYF